MRPTAKLLALLTLLGGSVLGQTLNNTCGNAITPGATTISCSSAISSVAAGDTILVFATSGSNTWAFLLFLLLATPAASFAVPRLDVYSAGNTLGNTF